MPRPPGRNATGTCPPAYCLPSARSKAAVGGGHLGATPWPWTINAAGRGAYFATKDEAIAAVLAIMERGYPYIDVGCFQIDLAYHPGVFRSLDEAFDPERNAQAAAQILATERLRAPDWATAVARYHSATPGLGGPYLERVRSALPTAKLRASYAQLQLAIDLQTESKAAPPPDQQANAGIRGRILPRVIYPAPIGRTGREPQIIYLGAVQTLPPGHHRPDPTKADALTGLLTVARTPQPGCRKHINSTSSSRNMGLRLQLSAAI